MQTLKLGSLTASRLAYGCMRLTAAPDKAAAHRAVLAALEAGYTLFDHADIYGGGACESLFGELLKAQPGLRPRMLLASKCGIRRAGEGGAANPQRYDFSRGYILGSCEGSLQRLGVDHLDLYLLHRPDYLMEPDEVAAAFDSLHKSGKVGAFGVSNFRPGQVAALQQACPMPLVANQVEISLDHLQPFDDGSLDGAMSGPRLQAWSPLRGALEPGYAPRRPGGTAEAWAKLQALLDSLAAAHHCDRATLVLAWLLRHPAGIQPIVGSTQPERIRAMAQADGVALSRDEWYQVLVAARMEKLA